jgi:hypothetical protein
VLHLFVRQCVTGTFPRRSVKKMRENANQLKISSDDGRGLNFRLLSSRNGKYRRRGGNCQMLHMLVGQRGGDPFRRRSVKNVHKLTNRLKNGSS